MKIKSRVQLVLWAVLFVVTMSFSAYGADGQIKISQPDSFPIVIDQPGSYVLTSNIVVSTPNVIGIQIEADNVTLDLNGHALIGAGKASGGFGTGIRSEFKKNVSIKNGTVQNFGGFGIRILSGTGAEGYSQVNYLRVSDNHFDGICADHCTITNCTANMNDSNGINARCSTINNCTANMNGCSGINAYSSTVTDCTVCSNGSSGIYARYSTIINCTVNKNQSDGIKASISTISDCTVFSNVLNCIHAESKCRIEGNNLRYSGEYGLYLQSSDNYAIKNSASDNASGNFTAAVDNYMPTSLTGADAANANIGW